eukprot:1525513-Rhodomonas_salina.1
MGCCVGIPTAALQSSQGLVPWLLGVHNSDGLTGFALCRKTGAYLLEQPVCSPYLLGMQLPQPRWRLLDAHFFLFFFLSLLRFAPTDGQTTADASSYGVSVTAELGQCTFADQCWHIQVQLNGSALGHEVLFIHSAASQIAFPCSLGDKSKCDCLGDIVSAYSATSIGDVHAACAASPSISSSLYTSDATEMGKVSVDSSGNTYTIIISDDALQNIGAVSTGSSPDVIAELIVGFADLVPMASLDQFDPVAHETM